MEYSTDVTGNGRLVLNRLQVFLVRQVQIELASENGVPGPVRTGNLCLRRALRYPIVPRGR